MNSSYLLLDDIRNTLVTAFANTPLREPVGGGQPRTASGQEKYRVPRVYIGNLPTKRKAKVDPVTGAESGEDVPYLLVKFLDGDLTGPSPREFTATVGILLTIYCGENYAEAGVQDALNALDRTVMTLAERDIWGGEHWQHVPPIHVVHGLSKQSADIYLAGLQTPGPYYQGTVVTQYRTNAPALQPPRHIIDQLEPVLPAEYQWEEKHGEEKRGRRR